VLWLTGVGSGAVHEAAPTDYGAMIVALNCLCYSAYVVFSRETVLAIGSRRLMAWVFTYGAILFAPLGASSLSTTLPTLTMRGFWLLAFIVAVPTILAYWLNAWALARSSATDVTIYIYLQPLVAFGFAPLLLGERWNSRTAIATVFIFAGVGLVVSRGRSRAVREISEHPDALAH